MRLAVRWLLIYAMEVYCWAESLSLSATSGSTFPPERLWSTCRLGFIAKPSLLLIGACAPQRPKRGNATPTARRRPPIALRGTAPSSSSCFVQMN